MLFEPMKLGPFTLKNRAVMAPMTRSRAVERNIPNALMATYYAQRAGAGLIVTEGTAPCRDALGYARIPGIYDAETAAGWRLVTEAVHAKGGVIFIQLMHTGRVAALQNLPEGARVVGPTDVTLPGEMYTDAAGMQPHARPHALTDAEVETVIDTFVTAAKWAREAGADGVEVHGANGYLVEQFLNANINTRSDRWGGSADNRNRFAIEVVRRVAEAIGAERVGIRLSPYGVYNHTGAFEGIDAQYVSLVRALSELGIAYVHVLDHSSMGAPPVPSELKQTLRQTFKGAFILAGGFDRDRAEAALTEGRADLIAFGRPFLANPDLVERMRRGIALNPPDFSTFYTPGPKGYTDYPTAT
jgi:N-ethylmaleimide reductase